MPYYLDPQLERIRNMIEGDVRAGVRVLTASYIARKHEADLVRVQRVLSDLVAVGDLEVHYRVLCSGEQQNYDVDREFTNKEDIPTSTITCTKCGDLYTPLEETISVFFEPTTAYLRDLERAS